MCLPARTWAASASEEKTMASTKDSGVMKIIKDSEDIGIATYTLSLVYVERLLNGGVAESGCVWSPLLSLAPLT
jgi:hypothetical protein